VSITIVLIYSTSMRSVKLVRFAEDSIFIQGSADPPLRISSMTIGLSGSSMIAYPGALTQKSMVTYLFLSNLRS